MSSSTQLAQQTAKPVAISHESNSDKNILAFSQVGTAQQANRAFMEFPFTSFSKQIKWENN